MTNYIWLLKVRNELLDRMSFVSDDELAYQLEMLNAIEEYISMLKEDNFEEGGV